jgi:3-dehydrosphinganine reductase
LDYRNTLALVTGGSSGIGLAIARLLAGRGARIWLLARDPRKLAEAQAEVNNCRIAGGPCCQVVSADVANVAQVIAAVNMVVDRDGVPDLVINSAGITYPGYFQDLDVDIFRQVMEVNYFGTLHVVKAVTPGMIRRGSGHLVNISSLAGLIGVFGLSAYTASKFAVSGFSDVLRAELKPLGVGVSIVFPSDTDTPMLAFEDTLKTTENRALAGNARVLSADTVAAATLRGVEKGRYIIIPGTEGKIFYRLSRLAGSYLYPIMDMMIARAMRREIRA